MNKDLPNHIKKIFKDPAPIIWQGVWLEILNLLLSDGRMVIVWTKLVALMKGKHILYKDMPLNQFLKWESKGFVAQVIKLKSSNKNQEDFLDNMQKYFLNKDIHVTKEMILTVYSVVNNG